MALSSPPAQGWPDLHRALSAPRDLSARQRWALAAAVLGLHLGLALWFSHVRTEPAAVGEPAPVMVELIAPAQSPQTPPAPPAPPVPQRVEPKPQVRVAATRSAEPAPFEAPPEPAKPTPVPAVADPAPTVSTAPAVAATTAAPVVAAPPPAPQAPRQLSMSAVRYVYQPTLVFPPASERLGEWGTVIVRVVVDERGRPAAVSVHKSSGFERLDQAALAWVRAARFEPYKEDGVPRTFAVNAPVVYASPD